MLKDKPKGLRFLEASLLLCTRLTSSPSVLSLNQPIFIGTILGAGHVGPNKPEKALLTC